MFDNAALSALFSLCCGSPPPSFLLVRNTRFPSFFRLRTHAHSLIFLPFLSPHLPSRRLAFMTGTHLLAVRRLHKGTLLFCLAYQGIKCARGQRGLATGFASSILSLSFSCALYLCLLFAYLRASIEKKTRQLDCLLLKKKSDGEFYEASPYLRGIKG